MNITWTDSAAPCPCGKKKQFRDCHERPWKEFAKKLTIPNNPALPGETFVAIQYEVEKNRQERAALEEYGFELPYPFTEWDDGTKFRVMFNKVLRCPNNQGFYEFLLDVLVNELDIEWVNEENLDGSKDHPPHFVAEKVTDLVRKYGDGKRPINLNELEGNSRFIFSLAFDIYSLKHSGHKIESLIHRLKNYDQFQGARYEIGVAAIFARANYQLTFLETCQEYPRPCEFLAVKGEHRFLVEVKSKGKKGALHQKDGGKKTRIGNLMTDALSKTTNDLPFLIFVDVNAPKGEEKTWRKEAERSMDSVEKSNPDFYKANYIILSTFPFHYDGENPASPTDYILYKVSPCQSPLRNPDPVLETINRGLHHFGYLPPNLQ